MNSNQTIAENFYNAFQNKDGESMIASYHEDIVFHDPAFGQLKGEEAKGMWQMLCNNIKHKPFELTYHIEQAEGDVLTVHWEAKYTFGKTKRPVHNRIKATLEFKDGLIVKHTDEFDLKRWAKQALGWFPGVFGNANWFSKRIQKQTNIQLKRYLND